MILAMFAMVLLTFGVGVYALIARIKSLKTGQLSVKAFKLMQNEMRSRVEVRVCVPRGLLKILQGTRW